MNIAEIHQLATARGIIRPLRRQQGIRELRRLSREGFRTYPQRALSFSSLKEFAKSPLHYIEYLTQPKGTTTPMTEGKVFEALLFGRDLSEDFVIFERPEPDKDFRYKVNQEARNAARAAAESSGRELIEAADLLRIRSLAALALQHPFMKQVRRYAFKHPAQRTITEPVSGLKLTGIPDLAYCRGKVGVDIKFVGSIAEFRQRIFGRQYAYWMQAAMYSLIYGYEKFYFFAVSSQPHHYAQAFYLQPDTLRQLREKLVQEVLMAFRWHLEQGFLSYSEHLQVPDYY